MIYRETYTIFDQSNQFEYCATFAQKDSLNALVLVDQVAQFVSGQISFETTSLPKDKVHHYHATITPYTSLRLNQRIFKKFEEENANILDNIKLAFDGRKNIYSPKELPFGDSAIFHVFLTENDFTTSERPPSSFKFKIEKVSEISMKELNLCLQRKSELSKNIMTAINSLDVLSRHGSSMNPNFISIGRIFYTSENAEAIFGGVEVWQGYYQSVRATDGDILSSFILRIHNV
ncbi:6250_t:CDS:2 [Acaulospora colombiana]|uniref:6250_t:CDS:1 n=1 Tax=Acaulospora colombiana TaxID=27376 RepID=A0ACA9MAC9_9GLOM|nr:6250_t:CDS:2 [Acaulospora colombiana]